MIPMNHVHRMTLNEPDTRPAGSASYPWFDGEYREAERATRRLERIYCHCRQSVGPPAALVDPVAAFAYDEAA